MGGGTIVAQGPPELVAHNLASHTGEFLRRYYEGSNTTVNPADLPPIDLPDLAKKPPKPKFIAPEKKMGVPKASKIKPESDRPKAKKAAAKTTRKPKGVLMLR